MNNQQLFDHLRSFKSYESNLNLLERLSEIEKLNVKESTNYLIQKYSIKSNNLLSNIIYVTNNKQYDRLRELLDLTDDTERLCNPFHDDDFARISLLFPNVNSILIPKKAERNLRRYVDSTLLKAIDIDKNKAIEKCLVFLSYLSSTYYTDNKWKPLSSVLLHEQLKDNSDNTYVYKAIIEALKKGTKQDGAIIEVMTNEYGMECYEVGVSSKQFRLTDTYLKAGLKEYLLTDESIIQQRNKTFYKTLFEAQNNVIAKNLVSVYQQIDLPTLDEVLAKGKQLAKTGKRTKRGKLFTMRNKHDNSYWKDVKERSFVEDNIELFRFLTQRGFMIPVIGGNSSGGRVVDSFNLMPSWIRSMIKIKGESIIECDFKAMHPNLASKIYDGSGKHISHQIVAEYLGIDVAIAKNEHLSFFNKPFYPTKKHHNKGSMVQSPVFQYYQNNEANMLNKIKEVKQENGYKKTTYQLFEMEVQIMTQIINLLNQKGIYVMYVYDALYCAESDLDEVKATMNQVINQNGVNTWVG